MCSRFITELGNLSLLEMTADAGLPDARRRSDVGDLQWLVMSMTGVDVVLPTRVWYNMSKLHFWIAERDAWIKDARLPTSYGSPTFHSTRRHIS